MTGPEHFAKAEQHLADAESAELGSPAERWYLDAAQTHATLALAAAGLRSLPAAQDTTN